MALHTEKDVSLSKGLEIEHQEDRRGSTAEELTELSGIESTATSKAAWLIAITVSLGGFLFGKLLVLDHSLNLTPSRLRYRLHLSCPGHHRRIPWP